jgi:hypothetical protein
MTKTTLDSIFDRYLKLNTGFENLLNRGFAFPETERKDVLFIGINPSYTKEAEPSRFEYNVEKAILEYPEYYNAFQLLADGIERKDGWTYTDLFYFRETTQKQIDWLVKQPFGAEFMWDQLVLTESIIEAVGPKIIVVCNAHARNYLGINVTHNGKNSWLGFEFEFDEVLGLHRIVGYNDQRKGDVGFDTPLRGTLVCFTSTLKYMDRYSRKRLQWQVKRALNMATKAS